MNIGIDIDGVLTDLENYIEKKGKEYLKKDVVNPSGEDIYTKFGLSLEEGEAFWIANYYDYAMNCNFKEKSKEIIDKLHEEGNKIFIVTARRYFPTYGFKSEEDYLRSTKETLKKNGINYDEYIYAPVPKVKEVIENKIDVMIEDSVKNIEEISKVTKVIIIDAGYNRDINLENTYRAKSWEEVYEIISNHA